MPDDVKIIPAKVDLDQMARTLGEIRARAGNGTNESKTFGPADGPRVNIRRDEDGEVNAFIYAKGSTCLIVRNAEEARDLAALCDAVAGGFGVLLSEPANQS